jgi:hypothetical protein
MLLRIDDIVSGIKKDRNTGPPSKYDEGEGAETFGDQRDG